MASIERSFIDGMIVKVLILGLIASLTTLALISPWWGLSVAAGAVVSWLNLLAVRGVSRRMVRAARDGQTGTALWSMLWVLKMSLLFGVTWLLLAVVGLSAPGFALGFSVFLPAIIWQAIVQKSGSADENDDEPGPHDVGAAQGGGRGTDPAPSGQRGDEASHG